MQRGWGPDTRPGASEVAGRKHNLKFKGWNSHVHGEFPGNYESTNLSRDALSREMGCSVARVPVLVRRRREVAGRGPARGGDLV